MKIIQILKFIVIMRDVNRESLFIIAFFIIEKNWEQLKMLRGVEKCYIHLE